MRPKGITKRRPSSKVEALALAFREDPHPSRSTVKSLSRRCGLPKEDVRSWFERRRIWEEWCLKHPSLRSPELLAAALLRCAEAQQQSEQRRHAVHIPGMAL